MQEIRSPSLEPKVTECVLEYTQVYTQVQKELAGFLFGIARKPTLIHKGLGTAEPDRQSDSSRPTRIGKAIRLGRPESTKRFESAAPNRHSVSDSGDLN